MHLVMNVGSNLVWPGTGGILGHVEVECVCLCQCESSEQCQIGMAVQPWGPSLAPAWGPWAVPTGPSWHQRSGKRERVRGLVKRARPSVPHRNSVPDRDLPHSLSEYFHICLSEHINND